MTTVRPTLKLPTIPINLRQYGILAAFAVIVVLFQVLTDGRLLLPGNINNLIQQNAYVLILAVGMVESGHSSAFANAIPSSRRLSPVGMAPTRRWRLQRPMGSRRDLKSHSRSRN